jgi:glycerate dehydrogenase
MMNIVVLDGFTLNPGDNPWTDVNKLGAVTVYERTEATKIVERAAHAEVILTNKTPLNAETLAQLPKLKFIGVLATGYNVVDVKAARARNIPVSNVPIYGTDAVAEFVMSLLLNWYRQPQMHSDLVKQGEWARRGDFCFWNTPLAELAGKTMGVVGFGRIGRRTGELAAAFKMKVLAYDTYQGHTPTYPFAWCDLPNLFAQADVVSLHCNLTPENTGMINKTLLSGMKKTAYLINTSRGPLVNEADLAEALNQGVIAGAACDVVSVEPIRAENPLLTARNITLTPHIAWAAVEARIRLTKVTVENIAAFQSGKPINVVN